MTDPLDTWPAFAHAVRSRLDAGRAAYGDRSFGAEPRELLGELQQEALDLAGWGFVLWRRLESALAAVGGAAADPTTILARGVHAERSRVALAADPVARAAPPSKGPGAEPGVGHLLLSADTLVLLGAVAAKLAITPSAALNLAVHALARQVFDKRTRVRP